MPRSFSHFRVWIAWQGRHARFGLRRLGERVEIEATIAPRDLGIVDVVLHAEVVERRQSSERDPTSDVGLIRDKIVEEPGDVGGVGAIGRGREAEQKSRIDGGEDASIRLGRGVMNLIDDDVVEARGAQFFQVLVASELGDRGEDQVRLEIFVSVEKPPHARRGIERAKEATVRARRLREELAPVSDEEEAWPRAELRAKLAVIKGGEPGLSQAGGEDDEGATTPLFTALPQLHQGFALDVVRLRYGLDRLGVALVSVRGMGIAPRPLGIGTDPRGIEPACIAPGELERLAHAVERLAVAVAIDAKVPLDARVERRAREVAAADEGNSKRLRAEAPRFGMKRSRAPRQRRHLDYPGFELACWRLFITRSRSLPVKEQLERADLGDFEIVTRDDPHAGAPCEGAAHRVTEAQEAGFLHKRRNDGDLGCLVE